MDIFKCQLPIEIHEDALYSVLNLYQEASKPQKEQFIKSQSLFFPFVKFLQDIFSIEHDILSKKGERFIVSDYNLQGQEELTGIDQLLKKQQQQVDREEEVIQIQSYEYNNSSNQMYLLDRSTAQPFIRVIVEGSQFEGQGVVKGLINKHL
jgi:hypothetical protein